MSEVPCVVYENGERHVLGTAVINEDGEVSLVLPNTERARRILDVDVRQFSIEPTRPEVIGELYPIDRDHNSELRRPIYKKDF